MTEKKLTREQSNEANLTNDFYRFVTGNYELKKNPNKFGSEAYEIGKHNLLQLMNKEEAQNMSLEERKKAQGLSLNVIIIAVLALLVLVILAVIFMGRAGGFRRDSGSCTTIGGSCSITGCTGEFERQISNDCDLDGDGSFNEGQQVDGVCCLST